jgi:hypothetical protein
MSPRRLRTTLALVATTAALGSLLVPTAPSSAATPKCSNVTPDGRCGMDLQRAWKTYTRGTPGVVASYVEAGINWHLDAAKKLVDRVYVNWREAPVPCEGSHMRLGKRTVGCHRVYGKRRRSYDPNRDGFVNSKDWSKDPRVKDANKNGYVDAEDLIVAFRGHRDRDHNGYRSDISGWDFYDDQNDPATYDTAYDHSDNQMVRLHHECPNCMILPVKAGAEALDRTDDLAKAWLYSADAGASVIVSVTADLGYSSFMRTAIHHLERKGVAMVEASNDFDSTDHQGGMFWPYVLPGNGVLPTSDGDGWTRSNYTSWGPHNVFSVATHGGTTSESTPTLGGVVALLLSWGRVAARRGIIHKRLSGPEAIQVLRATARRVTDKSLPWPGAPGEWNSQYGYGIPNLYRAMSAVARHRIPPQARIDGPAWYRLFDPTRADRVRVTGTIKARRVARFRWRLDAGRGPQPGKGSWFRIGHGSAKGFYSGNLGSLSLSRIPKKFWSRPFHLSSKKWLETAEEYTVTFRLTVVDAAHNVARDRRSISVAHDKTWIGGFPMKIRAGGESQPGLVDLQGNGRLAIVFGDADGFVHAVDPKTRRELPGWPAHTRRLRTHRAHRGVRPGHEPILSDVAVGDLKHNGRLFVVAASLDGRVYVFGPHGGLVKGWPKTLAKGVRKPAIPRPQRQYTRLPVRGAVSSPMLFDLDGDKRLEIAQAGWDGYVHVWRPNGANLNGWPVRVVLPSGFQTDPGYVLVNDFKLDSNLAVGYLQGPLQPPDVIVRPQFTETRGGGIQPAPFSFLYAYDAGGHLLPGWPAKLPGTVEYYGSAQEFVTEGSSSPVTANVTGAPLGPEEVAVSPVFSPPFLVDGTGHADSSYQAGNPGGSGSDAPVSFTTSGAFGKVGGVMTFAQAETGGASIINALLSPASGAPIENYEVAYPAAGGSARPGFPAARQGIDFLGQPIIADVTGDGQAEVIDGGDSNAMHAYTAAGDMAPGFPKWTTGWNLFAPTTGDLFGKGRVDVVSVTREGYLFAWRTPGKAAGNKEWWRAQHDLHNSGRYGNPATP